MAAVVCTPCVATHSMISPCGSSRRRVASAESSSGGRGSAPYPKNVSSQK
ncbi:hypothetical protein ACFXJ8_22320 [Nonomuraea sp. NPDC059194]